MGHTHSSIDQYFSTISKAIKSSFFIGSPLSLMDLVKEVHCRPPDNYGMNQKPIIRDK